LKFKVAVTAYVFASPHDMKEC